MPRITYTTKFKKKAVKMVLNGMGQSVAARKLGVSGKTIRDWVTAAHPDFKIPKTYSRKTPIAQPAVQSDPKLKFPEDDILEIIEQLKIENVELKAENAVLLRIVRGQLI